mgnify:CR=1 FL=1
MKKNVINEAIFALKKGEIIVYPTDTLYGIGADIKNIEAVEKIYDIKKRPKSYPISVAVSNIDSIKKIAYLDENSKILAEKFLPGPLCLILKKKDNVPDIVTSGKKNVAIRIPDNKKALSLTKNFGPITCTSANIHGTPVPNVINKIYMQFKDKISIYIDEGKLSSKPSTIVDATSDKIRIIRDGVISKKEIENVINNG